MGVETAAPKNPGHDIGFCFKKNPKGTKPINQKKAKNGKLIKKKTNNKEIKKKQKKLRNVEFAEFNKLNIFEIRYKSQKNHKSN